MRPIDADALKQAFEEDGHLSGYIEEFIDDTPTLDVAPVRKGKWELTVHSYYTDTFYEGIELAIYITARCNLCGCKHPDYQVFNKMLYAPEDADNDFRFNKSDEEAKALVEFKDSRRKLACYCPCCGAKMEVE